MNTKEQEIHGFGIIQRIENGDIIQIGLSESQYNVLVIFLSSMSKEQPLIRLPEEYNLITLGVGPPIFI